MLPTKQSKITDQIAIFYLDRGEKISNKYKNVGQIAYRTVGVLAVLPTPPVSYPLEARKDAKSDRANVVYLLKTLIRTSP